MANRLTSLIKYRVVQNSSWIVAHFAILLSLILLARLYMPSSHMDSMSSIDNESTSHSLLTIYVGDQLERESQYYNSRDIIPMLSRIGEQEGFIVKRIQQIPSIWIRDDFILLANGSFLVPSSDPKVLNALSDFEAYSVPSGHMYAQGQGRVARQQEIDFLKSFTWQDDFRIKESTVYLEGGNVLEMHKANGNKGILIGMSSLLISTFLLDLHGKFSEHRSFEAKLKATEQVIAQELGVNSSQVTYLDQPLFHLDMFLTPGPNGEIFIEDPDLSNKTLFRLMQRANLVENERKTLNNGLYLGNSLEEWQIALKSTADELRAAGYQVIGVPGEYQYKGDLDTNFMNGLMERNGQGKFYYITNQSPISSLNTAFKEALAHYGIEVFFINTTGLLMNNGGIHCVTLEREESL